MGLVKRRVRLLSRSLTTTTTGPPSSRPPPPEAHLAHLLLLVQEVAHLAQLLLVQDVAIAKDFHFHFAHFATACLRRRRRLWRALGCRRRRRGSRHSEVVARTQVPQPGTPPKSKASGCPV